MEPIVTGANIFRAKRILQPAEIFALDTTPVLLAPAKPGYTLVLVNYIVKLFAGSEQYLPVATASALVCYGPTQSVPATNNDVLNTLIQSNSNNSVINGITNLTMGLNPPPDIEGLALFLVDVQPGFNSGVPTAATVNPSAQGLLYALNDTGLIADMGSDGQAVYTVTGVGVGGLVTTVTVSGGNGYQAGVTYTTTPVTGSGDGSLELTITAVRNTGNGTVEFNLLYQPIP